MSDKPIYCIIKIQPGCSPELISAVERLMTLAREDASARLQAEARFVTKGDVYSDFERLFAHEIGEKMARQFAGRTWAFLTHGFSRYSLPYLVMCGWCDKLHGDCRCRAYNRAEVSKPGEEDWAYYRGQGNWKVSAESIIRAHPAVIDGKFENVGARSKYFMTRWVEQL